MKRLALGFLLLVAAAAFLVGCGGSFINATNREGYLLVNPTALQRVRLDNGVLQGLPVTLSAPSGIRAICYRNQSGTLFGMGGDKILYRISATNGTCTAISTAALAIPDATGALASSTTGSKLYYIASSGTSYQINPNTGDLVTTGSNVAFAAGDTNSGSPAIGGLAYGSNGKLYLSDGLNDCLVKIDDPLTGVAHTIGLYGVDVGGSSGLGVDPVTGKLYLAYSAGPNPGLYKIDEGTGVATQVGDSTLAAEGVVVIP